MIGGQLSWQEIIYGIIDAKITILATNTNSELRFQ